MPIPVFNYAGIQMPTGQSDIFGSLARGLELGFMPLSKYQQMQAARLANDESRLRNEYLPQSLQGEDERSRLANALSQINLDFAPQTAQADLRSKLLGNEGTTLSNALSSFNLGVAPQRFNMEQSKSLLDQLKAQTGAQSSARKSQIDSYKTFLSSLESMSPGQRTLYEAQHAQEISDMRDAIAKDAYQASMQLNPSELSPEQFNGLLNSGSYTLSDQPAAQQRNFPVLPPQNARNPEILRNAANSEFPNTHPFSTPAEVVENMKNASLREANNKSATTSTRMQMEGAVQLKDFIESPDLKRKVENAAKYAGVLRGSTRNYQTFVGKNPQALRDYESFTKHDLPLIINKIKQLEGLGSSNAQREELHGMYDILNSFGSNPERAVQHFQDFETSLDRLGRSVEKSWNVYGAPSIFNKTPPTITVVSTSKQSQPVLKLNPTTGKWENANTSR